MENMHTDVRVSILHELKAGEGNLDSSIAKGKYFFQVLEIWKQPLAEFPTTNYSYL